MKYIDADKLIAEIERRLKIVEPHKDTFESAAACRQELIWMKDFITSLQQEQPEIDLEKEIDNYIADNFSEAHDGALLSDASGTELMITDISLMARHFWNKGYNAGKEG